MTRIQLELPEERTRELEALMQEMGITTKKDLFNNALSALEWMVKEKKAGHFIASVNEKEQKWKELVMPALSHVS